MAQAKMSIYSLSKRARTEGLTLITKYVGPSMPAMPAMPYAPTFFIPRF